jgi:hypothetical protein
MSTTRGMYLKNVKLHNQWVNACTNPISIDVYWCLCMKNSKHDPQSMWYYANEYEKEGSGQANAQQWDASNANINAGKPGRDTYGQEPTTIKGFNEFWKVLKKERVELKPGGRCESITTLRYNYLAKESVMKGLIQDFVVDGVLQPNYPDHIAGLTIVPMFIARGHAIYNSAKARYTYSGGRFSCLTRQDYSFVPCMLEDKFPYNRVYNNVYSEAWTPANEKFIATQPYADIVPDVL